VHRVITMKARPR